MASIIIGFSRAKNPTIIGRLISWFENTDYTHVYLLTDSLFNTNVVLHADEFNVHIISEKNFLGKSIVVHQYRVELDEQELARFIELMLDLVGKPYSYKQLLIIAFNRTMKLWNLNFRIKYVNGSNSMICSELIEKFLLEIKGLKINYDLDAVTPKDIKHLCDDMGLEKID